MVRALDRALRVARASRGRRCASRGGGRRCRSRAARSSLPRTTSDALAGDVDGDEIARLGRLVGAHRRRSTRGRRSARARARRPPARGSRGREGSSGPRASRAQAYKSLDTSCYVGLHCANRDFGGGRDASARTEDFQASVPLRLGGRRRRALGRRRAAARRGRARPRGSAGRSGPAGSRSPGANNPVTLPIYSDNEPIGSGQEHRARPAQRLQLVGLHQPGRRQGVREGVRRQGQGHDVRERGGGAREADLRARRASTSGSRPSTTCRARSRGS